MMDILRRIHDLQELRGWSNYRLAKESGIPEGTLNNLFRLKNVPTFSTLEALCKGMNITLAQFFTENGEAVHLTPTQNEMLDIWNKLSKEQQRALLELFRTM
jgi:transcriptional regulator with XRE-family HTH domain